MEELKDREIGFGEWIRPGKSPIGVKIKMGAPASEAFRRMEDMMDSLEVLGVYIFYQLCSYKFMHNAYVTCRPIDYLTNYHSLF